MATLKEGIMTTLSILVILQAVFRIRIRIRMDSYQETIDVDPDSVKN